MSVLKWDQSGERFYETGVKHGVLYPQSSSGTYPKGYAWNGLVSVNESPSGAEANAQYADDIKYLNLYSAEEFGATVEAFTYPDQWAECDGSAKVGGVYVGQQGRKSFGLSYRTAVGNDIDGSEHGYKLHLIYSGMASPSEKSYQSINDSPEPITFSWEMTTTPTAIDTDKLKDILTDEEIKKLKPTAILTIDSRDYTGNNSSKLEALENALYGTDSTEPHLPLPADVIRILHGESVDPDPNSVDPDPNDVTEP